MQQQFRHTGLDGSAAVFAEALPARRFPAIGRVRSLRCAGTSHPSKRPRLCERAAAPARHPRKRR